MKPYKKSKISVMIGIAISIAGIVGIFFSKRAIKNLIPKKSVEERYKAYYLLTFDWLAKKNDYDNFDEQLNKYFTENNVKTIAIYGAGSLGELFYNEINGSNLKTAYFIDKNAEDIYLAFDNIPLTDLDGIERQENVDAVVVTPVYDFNEISEELRNACCNLKVVSLEDIIYSL